MQALTKKHPTEKHVEVRFKEPEYVPNYVAWHRH